MIISNWKIEYNKHLRIILKIYIYEIFKLEKYFVVENEKYY